MRICSTIVSLFASTACVLAAWWPMSGKGDNQLVQPTDVPYAEMPSVDPRLLRPDIYASEGAQKLPVVAMVFLSPDELDARFWQRDKTKSFPPTTEKGNRT